MRKGETKGAPTRATRARRSDDSPRASVALASAEFCASAIGAAVLADPLLVDCYRALREEGESSSMSDFVVWKLKTGLQRELPDCAPLLSWNQEKRDFCASPRLEAYRLRRSKADAEPVLVRDGWDEAFADLMIEVVKERVRRAERCPAAQA